MSYTLNRIDKNIISILQRDGRITYAQLAREVGLSTTPCIERVRRLEREGVIKGFSARIDPASVDAALVVYVQIRLNHTSGDIFASFKQSALDLEEIQECHLVSGDFDYLVKVRVKDMHAYREFLGETLLKLPGVQESTSIVVMEEVKETLAVPIRYD